MVHIGKALRVNPSLVELSLSKHRMGDYGVSTLVGFLKSNKARVGVHGRAWTLVGFSGRRLPAD